jgi:hypothetical protein
MTGGIFHHWHWHLWHHAPAAELGPGRAAERAAAEPPVLSGSAVRGALIAALLAAPFWIALYCLLRYLR